MVMLENYKSNISNMVVLQFRGQNSSSCKKNYEARISELKINDKMLKHNINILLCLFSVWLKDSIFKI